jgi:hypothetical protein
MKITIESTTRTAMIHKGIEQIEARVWEGETESGIKVVALIPRIAAPADANLKQFDLELKDCRPPTDLSDAFPLRMIL